MHESDLNRVVFFSKEDMAGGYQLQKGERILRKDIKLDYSNINDILELYNIKKYIDNELYLKTWTQDEIKSFKQKAKDYGKVIGRFISTIDDKNAVKHCKETLRQYIPSFWELINNQNVFKRISKNTFSEILTNDPHLIHEILNYKKLVIHYDEELKNLLINYPQSAEILLSVYEVQDIFKKNKKFIPKSLSIQDKENIISTYLDSNDANMNYVGLIQNIRNRDGFKVSDKTRLKAKRLQKAETEEMLSKSSMKYGVSISFPENSTKLKDVFLDEDHIAHYSYSLDYIKVNNDFYTLFKNFTTLFEYLDEHNRISLVSKKSQFGIFESVIGIRSLNEYRTGTAFRMNEMTSQGQIYGYGRVLNTLNIDLINILNYVYTSQFQESFGYAENARFLVPSITNSHFEKVRILAPEFESVLKQFKLFVEEGNIDYELLQISSAPSSIKDIPSLNQNKYFYLNEENIDMVNCSNLFFSDQTLLSYVEPFKEEKYRNFFDLLLNEQVHFNNYDEYQRPKLNYLIDKGFISIDDNGFIQVTNWIRLSIFDNLNENEVVSYYRYPTNFQEEVKKMASENILYFESSLFSKPEKSYFNYYLNKSEFTNGLDLRNSYLHGTQANPEEENKHEDAYFTYLKLLFLVMLKIEDDLDISTNKKNV